MAKKSNSQSLKDTLIKQYDSAERAVRPIRQTWAEKEEMLLSKITGKNPTGNKVSEGSLASIIWERAARVMAQLPTGTVSALSKDDAGKNALMNVILTRYIQPNANSQFDHLTKLRMWDLYSMVYGAMPMLYDYRVDDEYIGPDCWLINPRNFFPQPGKNNINDAEWVMVSTFVGTAFLESKKKSKTWNSAAITRILDQINGEGARPSARTDHDRRTATQIEREDESAWGDTGEVELVTKYERGKEGRWITFAPDYDGEIIRDIQNPHESGRIPVVIKYSFPLVDSIWGIGDFERGGSLQKGIDTLVNMYLAGEKLRIAPPIKIDTTRVTAHTIRFQPNAKWDMRDMNAVQPYLTSPQGVNGFQAAYSFMKSAMLNQNGTTDTQINQEASGNPSFGKTPEALKQLNARESTRDNWDRFFMEKAVEELYEGMINLLAGKMEKPINIHIFDEEINRIKKAGMDDVVEVYKSGLFGKATISKKHISAQYRYEIDANTTMASNDQEEHERLGEVLMTALKVGPQNIQMLMQQDGSGFSFSELFKRWLITGGTKDWEKILPPIEETQAVDPNNPNAPNAPQAPQGMTPQPPVAAQPLPPAGPTPDDVLSQFNDPAIAQVAQQILTQ